MGMTQRDQRTDFAAEAFAKFVVFRRQLVRHGKLEHHVGPEVTIEGTIDMPHATPTDPPQDLVATLGDLKPDPFVKVALHDGSPWRRIVGSGAASDSLAHCDRVETESYQEIVKKCCAAPRSGAGNRAG